MLRAFGMAVMSITSCIVSHKLMVYHMGMHLFQAGSAPFLVLFQAFLSFFFFLVVEHSVSHDEFSGSSVFILLYLYTVPASLAEPQEEAAGSAME